MRVRLLLPVVALATSPSPALAQQYTLQTSGTIYSLYGNPGYTNDGRVANNSPFSVTISYNTSAVVSSTTTTGNDSLTIYTLPAAYSYTVGSYSQSGSLNGILIVGDNHDLGGGFQIEDEVGFVSNNGPYTNTPFNFNGGPVYTGFQVNAYDLSQQTLSGTGLDAVGKYGAFPNQFVEFSFTNSAFDNSVVMFGNVTSSQFYAGAPAVPEPAAWTMMILGLGAIGGAMRYRRRRTTLAFS